VQATKPTQSPHEDQIAKPNGASQIPNSTTAPLPPQASPPTPVIRVNVPGQTTAENNPSQGSVTTGPQPLYAANLGIYYLRVPYHDGTFGARLTQAPDKDKPAATLTIDTNDVIFLLNDQRFKKSDDLFNHFGPTTVGYIDSWTNTIQSGTITLPPQRP
jgi:hypothetical protein